MKQNFQIRNGFRNRIIRIKNAPMILLPTLAVILLAFLVSAFNFVPSGDQVVGGAALANMPTLFGFKFDKKGLEGDNLKLVESLEKRMSLEPDSKAKEELTKLINDANKEMLAVAERMKDLDDDKVKLLKELLGTDDKGVRAMIKSQGEAIQKLTDKLNKAPEDLSIRAQVGKWITDNKTSIDKIKAGEQNVSLPAMELRLNSPMLPSNTLNGSAYIPRPEFESGATEFIRPRLTFWDYIRKGRSSSAVYVWVNKVNAEGAAAFIGPGVAKPGVSMELESQISNAKKVAASEKVALELLDDVEGFASYIEQELKFQVDKATNTALMTAAGSATVPTGIRTLSTTYTLVGVETPNPNYYDVIRAAVAQLRSGNLDGAVTVFVNPVDKANMDLTKASSQGQLFMPNPPAATIVEDNNIPVGFFQAAILDNYHVKIYKDYTVTYGWENDDFTKNLVTLVGERRLHQYFKTPHTGSFIYDSFANVQAAIAAA